MAERTMPAASVKRGRLTRDEVLDLPPMVDLVTAGRALGMSRESAYRRARAGEFPVPVEKIGNSLRVRTSDVHKYLGIDPVQEARVSAWVQKQLATAPKLTSDQRDLLRRLLSPDIAQAAG